MKDKKEKEESKTKDLVPIKKSESKDNLNNMYFLIGITLFLAAAVVLMIQYSNDNNGSDLNNTEVIDTDELASCLTYKGFKMYGAFWCSACASQKELFGESFDKIIYVECSPEGQSSFAEECKSAGIKAFPTWGVNGRLLNPGVYSLEALKEGADC